MATDAFSRLILAARLAGTNNGDGTITIDLADAGPGATGPLGDSTHTPIITIDAKGRVTALTSTAISGAGSGGELGYAQITADPVINSVTEATPVLIVSLGSITYAASLTLIEFFTPKAYTLGGKILILSLWDGVPGSGGTNLGYMASYDARGETAAANTGFPVHAVRRLTPSAGSHNYGIYGFVLVGTAVSTGVSAGAGGVGTFLPAFVRASLV
jgi:hypothetical protein